ncbi:3-hydroxybutyryl-CoA dehydratase [Trichoderma chlorosporum]
MNSNSPSSDSGYNCDDWPKMPDGTDYDRKQLLDLVHNGKSPFSDVWDVNQLIQEIEEHLGTKIVDIPFVYDGANSYGFHCKLSNRSDILARLARSDVNMPNYDGYLVQNQICDVQYEAALNEISRSFTDLKISKLLYWRLPVQHTGLKQDHPKDILGRRLQVFERAEGEKEVWRGLSISEQSSLLLHFARIRASLFNFQVPLDFTAAWFLKRLFGQKPDSLPAPISATREFCVTLFTSKIEATIGNIGDMIGWEDDHNTVGPRAAEAKQSLLRLIPHIIPTGDTSLFRFVLEHGDFGIHNMSIALDADGKHHVTSVFDWDMGSIVPAFLSDPMMCVGPDLGADGNAHPLVLGVDETTTPEQLEKWNFWAKAYCEGLFNEAPDYERVIRAGKDARHLWFALRDWRGDDPEGLFGDLGEWAEKRMKELGVDRENK